MRQLCCDMTKDCPNPISHMGERGWLYCSQHAPLRAGFERCRKLRKWEVSRLESGHSISYKPGRNPERSIMEEQQDNYNAMVGESLNR
jgi:hypothetical protein